MTEQEAKTKWCPHMTYLVNPHQVIDGMAAEYVQAQCSASECMAWRWDCPPVLEVTIYRRLQDMQGHDISLPFLPRHATEAEWDAAWAEVEGKCRGLNIEIDVPDGWEPAGDDGTVFFGGNDGPYWYREFKRSSDPGATGYCGLAGRP